MKVFWHGMVSPCNCFVIISLVMNLDSHTAPRSLNTTLLCRMYGCWWRLFCVKVWSDNKMNTKVTTWHVIFIFTVLCFLPPHFYIIPPPSAHQVETLITYSQPSSTFKLLLYFLIELKFINDKFPRTFCFWWCLSRNVQVPLLN